MVYGATHRARQLEENGSLWPSLAEGSGELFKSNFALLVSHAPCGDLPRGPTLKVCDHKCANRLNIDYE